MDKQDCLAPIIVKILSSPDFFSGIERLLHKTLILIGVQ
jgi:hypothetical protein